MSLVKILIVADEKTSMGVIMQGYLQFYSNGNYETYVLKPANEIHPIAIQVMKEDGIDITTLTFRKITDIKKSAFQICIIMNENFPPEVSNNNTEFFQLNFNDPLVTTSYDVIVGKFRTLREEIKRSAIEITGKLSLAM